MSTQPARGDDRDLGVDSDRLAAVLRAATAPAHPGELAGEEAAVAAFRAAADAAPAAPSLWRTVLAKVLTVKAVVAVVVAGSAGVVVAATGGVLPTPWSAGPPVEQSSTAPPPSTDRPAEPSSQASPESTAPDPPSIAELCRRYASHEHPEKALNDPAFRPLVTAAGKKGKVRDYCAEQANQPPKTGDEGTPPPGNKPPNNGNGKPTDSGKPENKGKPEHTGGNKPKKTGNDKQTGGPQTPRNTAPDRATEPPPRGK